MAVDDTGKFRAPPGILEKPGPEGSGEASAAGMDEEDREIFLGFVAEAAEHLSEVENDLLELENDPGNAELIAKIFRAFHSVKGGAGFMGFKRMNGLSHATEELLSLIRDGKLAIDHQVTDAILRSVDVLNALIANVRSSISESVRPGEGQVEVDGLIRFITAVGKRVPSREIVAAPPDLPFKERRTDRLPLTEIRVGIEKIEALTDLVKRLVIGFAQSDEKDLEIVGIVGELQETAMSLRLIPLRDTFNKMKRLVRDLSGKVGKKVDFRIMGEDTEIDRQVVEKLGDPLIHMLRNALDHGLETPGQRSAAGKQETGMLRLEAEQTASTVVITIADDGRGLDRGRILAKAVENGVAAKEAELSDPEVWQLIFAPGFSTAAQVTDVSGRGVGMDVVRKTIESMNGKIDIESSVKTGTSFRLVLPLSMAIADAMLVRVGAQKFLIPIAVVAENYLAKAEEVYSVSGRGEVIKIRNQVLPVTRLNEVFGIDCAVAQTAAGVLVITKSDDALLVDEIVDQQQIVVKPLEGLMTGFDGCNGTAILSDGTVGLVLDIEKIREMKGKLK